MSDISSVESSDEDEPKDMSDNSSVESGNEDEPQFSLVEFIDNSMQIVPISWLKGNSCAYPPYKSDNRIMKAAKLKECPQKNWQLYHIFKTLGSFSECEFPNVIFVFKIISKKL